jgi:FKBP-type peptidyl-prolyl cis-trans isomerase FkpA
MAPHPGALRIRFVGTVAAAALGLLTLAGCGSLVEVSSHITPVPLSCATPRAATAVDSFSTAVTLQPGASGLQYGDISVGCGKVASDTDTANVQFTVWLQDGTQVITTRGAGQPTNSLPLGSTATLPFWRVGVPGMRVGGVRKLVVPPALAFGSTGSTSANVPANATLIVDVELISIS